jgi:four helix bundle protein
MLRIYSDCLVVVRYAGGVAKQIARSDADLARQLRRAATSIPLNVAEGSGVAGGNRRVRYATALGSAREVRACFDCADALGYVDSHIEAELERLDKVIATLYKLTR